MNDLPDAHARADDAEREVRRLEEENATLKAEVEGLKANIRVLAEDAFKWREHWIRTNLDPATPPPRAPDSVAEENAGLRALLREVEWSAREGRDLDRACPICSEWECLGRHAPDCRLKAALG